MSDIETVKTRFKELYGARPDFVVRAPGRVNLIGEHTDYNDGFVFPAAIDFQIVIAGSLRQDRQVRAFTLNQGVGQQATTFSLDDIERSRESSWSNYLRSVAFILQREGFTLRGMNAVFTGSVPIGSGLSSSAAMEMSSSLALETAGGFALEPVKRALLGQQAEWEPKYVGVKCGIMDQFVSALGQEDHALFLDTRTLAYETVPLPREGVVLLIANTNVRHELAGDDSAYNARRSECEQSVSILKQQLPGIHALRDVTVEQFELYKDRLPEPLRRRARHVVTEDARVLESVGALKTGDISGFGRLMYESHDSLRDDYEVSCRELDVMVESAKGVDGVHGSRMTGAGFGGCTISLVDQSAVPEFEQRVGAKYRDATGLDATFYVCHAAAGANRIE